MRKTTMLRRARRKAPAAAAPLLGEGATTRQLIAMIAAFACVAILAPVAANAADSLVSIVDASSGQKAKVQSGHLDVGDSKGPLTVDGNVNATVQTVGGTVATTVGNTVTTAQSFPATVQKFVHFDSVQCGGCVGGDFIYQQSGPLEVTTVSYSNDAQAAQTFSLNTASESCSGGPALAGPFVPAVVPAGQTVTFTFPQPVEIDSPCPNDDPTTYLMFKHGDAAWVSVVGFHG